jgi:dTDP-L-rhamnose 4-epimerase
VVEATYLALTKNQAANQVLGIGAGEATTVLEVARKLMDAYSAEIPIKITGAFRLGDIRHNLADLSKARALLGFKPKISFEEGINKFSKWVLSQEVSEDNFDRSMREMRERGMLRK